MEELYFIPAGNNRADLKIKNSRFIGFAYPCKTPEEARELLQEIRREHPGCTHVVHAYVLGQKGSLLGQSDDGEPKGTAGRPVLEILKGRRITNILVAVVRYFGGTKLGTGGLVKAYGDTAKEVLENLPLEEEIPRMDFRLFFPYTLHNSIHRILSSYNCTLLSESFGEQVTLEARAALKDLETLEREIIAASAGTVYPEHISSEG